MSFAMEGYGANRTAMSQAAGASMVGGVQPADAPRTEQILSMAGVLCEQTNGLASRLESLDARLLGASNPTGDKQSSAPQPVRSAVDEIQYRLSIAHSLVQRCFDAINRLERL